MKVNSNRKRPLMNQSSAATALAGDERLCNSGRSIAVDPFPAALNHRGLGLDYEQAEFHSVIGTVSS